MTFIFSSFVEKVAFLSRKELKGSNVSVCNILEQLHSSTLLPFYMKGSDPLATGKS